jgi:hypothetical protein
MQPQCTWGTDKPLRAYGKADNGLIFLTNGNICGHASPLRPLRSRQFLGRALGQEDGGDHRA